MPKHLYRVNRHMQGDKSYVPGDERKLTQGEAAHMVRSGALTDLGPAPADAADDVETKVEDAVETKVEPAAPAKAPKAKAPKGGDQ